jgi:mannosyl-3-phosphoglycerate phosphatase
MNLNWLIFTDLDGTLLDHHSYDYSPALPALQRLQARNIPIIPVSSKTLAELEGYVTDLGLSGPVIAENGCVIRLPGRQPLLTDPPYPELRDYLQKLRRDFGWQFSGFGDMTVQQVVEATGLSESAARLAMQRLASEPLLWQDGEERLHAFRAEVQTKELRLLQGGRFLHLLGDMDKGRALNQVVDWYRLHGWNQIKTIALGDSGNDIDMLLCADIPVIIQRPNGSHLDLPERTDAVISELPGPAGWNQVLNRLLDRYGD